MTKFCLWVDIQDLITYATFGDDRLRVLGVAMGRISRYPIDLRPRPYNTFALLWECVISTLGRPWPCPRPQRLGSWFWPRPPPRPQSFGLGLGVGLNVLASFCMTGYKFRRESDSGCVLVHRCLHNKAPPYLAENLHLITDVDAGRRLRSASTSTLTATRQPAGDRAFPVAAACVWNYLPSSVGTEEEEIYCAEERNNTNSDVTASTKVLCRAARIAETITVHWCVYASCPLTT